MVVGITKPPGVYAALHAILNSLSPAAPGNHSEPANLRADQVRKLSDKLGEILGDEVESGDGTRRNENGEVGL